MCQAAGTASSAVHSQYSGWGGGLLSSEASARATFSRPPLLTLPDRAGTASTDDSKAFLRLAG